MFLNKMKKGISLLMMLLIVMASAHIPAVYATETEAPAAETLTAERNPAEAIPSHSVPVETVPGKIIPAETVPVETTPGETIPEEPAPAEPEETVEREVAVIPSLEELPEVSDGYDQVPLYFQTDYPNNMYGRGTIANNGCGITCLAMVATYLTGHEYLPDELAGYFGGVAENNIERLEKGAEAMQLPWEKMENFHKAMEALREGKVVIALMDSLSLFTDEQHFIVLTGFNEDGLIMVNDPFEPNYNKWDLLRFQRRLGF